MFRKRNRLVRPQNVMHRLKSKQTSEIIVNKMYKGLHLISQTIMIFILTLTQHLI